MALFALREGYRVETTPTGGRVVHVRTGDTLELNFSEIQLLARAAAGGLEGTDPALKTIVRKLSGLGLLERVGGAEAEAPPPAPPLHAAAAAAAAGPEGEAAPEGAQVEEGLWVFAPPQDDAPAQAGPETPTEVTELPRPAAPPPVDPAEEPKLEFAAPAEPEKPAEPPPSLQSPDLLVPIFRADLVLKRKDKGGVFDVTDPQTNRTFAFYDFEISIARMLNGQRKFGEVVSAANGLGIPVSVESLSQFVRQLQRYGFLAPDGTKVKDPPPGSIWGKRAKWNNSIRTLYQSGLRLTRQGRYYEAAAYFEAILEHDPGNPEAVEMLDQVKLHLSKLPPDAPPPHPHLAPDAAAELAATQEGLAAVEAELPAQESSLENLDGSIGDPAATTTTDQPEPGPEAAQPLFQEISQQTTEVADLSAEVASLAGADKPSDWSEFESSAPPLAMPDEPPPFDPFAEPIAAVQPLGLNAPAAPEPSPEQTFDPFSESPVAAPDPFPVAPLKTRAPTINPFARPVDRPIDLPRATPDPFAALPAPAAAPAAPAAKTAVPEDAKPFDPFADAAGAGSHDGHQPLEALLDAEPELPKFDAAALEAPPEPPLPASALPELFGIPAETAPVALPAPAEPAVVVDPAAQTVAESAAPSLAEAVLEPIPDETLDVEGVEPLPEAAPPAEPEPAAVPPVESPAPLEAAAPAAAEPPKPSSPQPARPPSAPALPAPKLAPPPPSKAKFLFGGLGLAAVAGGALWFFALRAPPAPQLPPKLPVVAVVAGPDARAPAAPGADAAAAAVEVAAVDASAPAAAEGPDAAAEAGPDAAAAGLDAAAAGADAAAPGLDAAALAVTPAPAGSDEGWTAVDVAKRGRVNMGDLKAPVAGTVTWGVTPNQERVRKGQVVGKISDADGNEVALMSPNVGLLATKAADSTAVQANEVIARVPYFEAYGQTTFPGTVAPTPDWPCEIVDEATGQKAACKVNKAEPRKGGFFVTFTAEPLWYDTAAKLKLRLKAP
ncbi:MAG TPA: hypothetical protein VGK67_28090 [Myxococcales bacterium]|jgi:hypothetical protein